MKTAVKEVITFTSQQVAKVCDHTFLKRTEAYKNAVSLGESPSRQREKEFFLFLEKTLASKYLPYAVCVRAEDVPHAYRFFQSHKAKLLIVAVAGFPDGHWYKSNFKLFEAQFALAEGAKEIDLVMNYQALKEGNHSEVFQEVRTIAKAVHSQGGKLKLIVETSELNEPQMIQACNIASHAGADFVKTSTGFGAFGAQAKSLEILCRNFHGGIKISGGITADNIQQFLSCVHGVYGNHLTLQPDKFRIGESLLLETLALK